MTEVREPSVLVDPDEHDDLVSRCAVALLQVTGVLARDVDARGVRKADVLGLLHAPRPAPLHLLVDTVI